MHEISSNRRSRLAGSLAAALLLGGTTLPVAAQQAPGWLNWGGGSNEQPSGETADDSAPGSSSAQATPMPAASVTVADTGVDPGSQSGQAVLLQRLMQRVNDLERQVQSMRGQLSEQERALERQQRALDEAAQSRPPQRASGSAGASSGVGAEDPVAQDVPDETVAAVDGQPGDTAEASSSDQADANTGAPGGAASEDEQQALYNEAFEVLKSGKYEQAIDAFQQVIDANPKGSWAASALFWQGETYYVQQDYAAAGKAYGEVIERFPDSNRIPDAKLKLGYVAQERGDNDAARRVFNELVADYPDSQAAGLAKQRLSRMGN
ncbi:tol-pal system protein YbgF [Guyparkeria halophila]|uniref:Cell division coordinator CpoB n=1 Tax=Guyparkeria halophila TaxID=47960 RepID=A0ABZ0YVR7_9GAMM|nr:tol-pal system protein YbgF [Guyparkeria halophila]WQH16272.1 tol-pal system protein YbgF [Guyparkeria halophila]